MYPRPALDFDRDSSDPLNPTVNYTHFQPSPEQRDPRIPLGFKIYGIGCLAAFLLFSLILVIYVVFNKRIRNFRKSRDEKSKQEFRLLGKPSLPNSLECDTEDGQVHEKSCSEKGAALCPRPPTCTSSSYEGENVRWRGKTRELGSWDSSVTMVNAGSPRLPPTSHLPMNDGTPSSTHTPILTSNIFTLNKTPISTLIAPLDPPVSPKTISAMCPTEPVKAVTTDGVHRAGQGTRRSSPVKEENNRDLTLSKSQHLAMLSNRNPGSSPKGILKTSPTYIARDSCPSTSRLSGHTPPCVSPAKDGIDELSASMSLSNLLSARKHINNSPKGSTNFRSVSSRKSSSPTYETSEESSSPSRRPRDFERAEGDSYTQFIDERKRRRTVSANTTPVSPACNAESHIVHLGPEPKQVYHGTSSARSRRVSISIPSRSSTSSSRPGYVALSRSRRSSVASASDERKA
ncbi:hypothetical protein APHAL10511_005574 [Amanita phalloides]|nr:hypothetical protein APHAL10511_005574 [Amanita phalloides]